MGTFDTQIDKGREGQEGVVEVAVVEEALEEAVVYNPATKLDLKAQAIDYSYFKTSGQKKTAPTTPEPLPAPTFHFFPVAGGPHQDWVYINTPIEKKSNTAALSLAEPFLNGKVLRVTPDISWDYGKYWLTRAADLAALRSIHSQPTPTLFGEKIKVRGLSGKWVTHIDLDVKTEEDGGLEFNELVPYYLSNVDKGIMVGEKFLQLHGLHPLDPTELPIHTWRDCLWQAMEIRVLTDGIKTGPWQKTVNFGKMKKEEDGCHCHDCFHKEAGGCITCTCCCVFDGSQAQQQITLKPLSTHATFAAFNDSLNIIFTHTDNKLKAIVDIIRTANSTFLSEEKTIHRIMGPRTLMVQRTAAYYGYHYAIAMGLGDTGHYKRRLDRLTKVFAQEILVYLLASCLGEARHVLRQRAYQRPGYFPNDKLPVFAQAVLQAAPNMNREPSWPVVRPLMEVLGSEEILIGLSGIFNGFHWGEGRIGYGGPKWGQLADAGLMLVRKEIPPAIFIDTIISMVHNGGWAFNKWYYQVVQCCSKHKSREAKFTKLLDIKANDASGLWNMTCLPKDLQGLKFSDKPQPKPEVNELWARLNSRRGTK